MKIIAIQPIANQSLTVNLETQRYDFTIKETRGVMSVSIARDNEYLVRNLRMVAGTPLLPYRHLMDGNFFLLTDADDYPDYTQFNTTQQLIYLTQAEIETYQTTGLIEPTSFTPSLSYNFLLIPSLTSPQGFEAVFTRAGDASYYDSTGLLLYATTDEPRFDYDPTTLAPRGLLIEGSAINITTYSQDLSNAAWTKTNGSVVANTATAPDGNTTADSLADNVTNGVHTAAQTHSFTSGTAYTLSVFLKADERTVAKISLPASAFPGTPYVFANLITGDLGTPQDCVARITELINGWWRVEITATADATTTGAVTIGLALDLTTDSYAGNGDNLFVWGIQVEAGSYASSYIPTTTIAVTRAAEKMLLDTDGWLAEQIGTFFTETQMPVAGFSTGRTAGELSDGTTNNILKQYVDGADSYKKKVLLKESGNTEYTYDSTAYGFTAPLRIATAYKENAVISAIDGLLSTFDDDAVIPDFTDLSIGTIYAGTQALNGWIRELQYYPLFLPNQTLKGMTE